jgi:hypothetical protein
MPLAQQLELSLREREACRPTRLARAAVVGIAETLIGIQELATRGCRSSIMCNSGLLYLSRTASDADRAEDPP